MKIFLVLLLSAGSLSAAELREVSNYDAIHEVVRSAPSRLRVVNLWATWCAPCVAEMKDLQKIADRFPRVTVVGISLDDAIPGNRAAMKSKVEQFLAARRVKFLNYYFTGRQNELTDKFNFEGGLPVTFVYDSDGKEVARVTGQINYDAFAAKLALLEKKQKR